MIINAPFAIPLDRFVDDRGWFIKGFSDKILASVGSGFKLVETNFSFSANKGTIRGLHFQIDDAAETKILTCILGSIFDIAVDIRKNSPTFGKCWQFDLNFKSPILVVIPEGFAHGFQTLEDNTSLIYLTTQFYSQDDERGINYLEPLVGIQWERPPAAISIKDHDIPFLSNTFKGI